ncbi:MAG: hypothetical protein KKA55_06060 [Proteobacteria bacterium]|nr:hypothetical protein [Pseudomonadota bacterium]MBU1595084.1 hypothetical protein [Pseudomonadota bacterium]
MKSVFKKLVMMVGGTVALLGTGFPPAQAIVSDSQPKIGSVTEKTQLVLTQSVCGQAWN